MVKKNDIILLIFSLIILYIFFEINNLKKNKENFNELTEQEITTAVKKIYLTDVEAIRLLSNFAIQLSQGGSIISNNFNVDGNIIVDNNLVMDSSIANQSNITAGGTITAGNTITAGGILTASNNTNQGGKISIINSLKNTELVTKEWAIFNMKGENQNKLCFYRYNGTGIDKGALINLYDNGTVEIQGPLTVKTLDMN
jgi:hypothetical protein